MRLLMKVKEESEEAGLKFKIQKMKIMASSPITSWQVDGETVATVRDFIFSASKITADCHFSHEMKRCLLLWRKAMTHLDSTLKSRDIALSTKFCIVKAMYFLVVMYGCKSWTIKKAECQRIELNYGVGENSWESLGLQEDQAIQPWRKSIMNIHWNNWCWSWSSNTFTIWCKKLTL